MHANACLWNIKAVTMATTPASAARLMTDWCVVGAENARKENYREEM